MGLPEMLAQFNLNYIVECELLHFGFALLLGGSVFLACYLILTIWFREWPERRIFWLSILLAFPFASMSHFIADTYGMGF